MRSQNPALGRAWKTKPSSPRSKEKNPAGRRAGARAPGKPTAAHYFRPKTKDRKQDAAAPLCPTQRASLWVWGRGGRAGSIHRTRRPARGSGAPTLGRRARPASLHTGRRPPRGKMAAAEQLRHQPWPQARPSAILAPSSPPPPPWEAAFGATREGGGREALSAKKVKNKNKNIKQKATLKSLRPPRSFVSRPAG